jgi:hypothetical protein
LIRGPATHTHTRGSQESVSVYSVVLFSPYSIVAYPERANDARHAFGRRSQIAVKPQERRGDEMVLFIIYSRWAAAGRGMVEWNGLND